jgi:hypothetical protein
MNWDSSTEAKFRAFISKIPIFHRGIAEEVATKKAEEIARTRNSTQVEDQDVIGAFFSDVPSPFYSMMVRLLEQTGFDYKRYGYPTNSDNKQ